MPEKEHIEGMLRMLQKLQEAASGAGGTFATKHSEKAQQYISEVTKQWAEKATNNQSPSQQKEARREAQIEAQRDNYNATNPQNLREATKNLKNTLRMVETQGRQVPGFLKDYADKPQTATVARLIERITIAPDELRNDSNFLLHEAAKAYWGTNWMELTREQASQVRKILDITLNKAMEIAAREPGYPHILDMITEQAFWKSLDRRFDLYRTDKLEERVNASRSATTEEERQHDRLAERLATEQKYLDNLDPLSLEKEKEMLEELKKSLARGKVEKIEFTVGRRKTKETPYKEEEAESYVKKINERLSELSRETRKIPARREEIGQIEEEILSPLEDENIAYRALADEQIRENLNNVTSEGLKTLGKEILDTYETASRDALEELRRKLDDFKSSGKSYDDIREDLQRAGRESNNEAVQSKSNADRETIRELESLVRQQSLLHSRENRPAREGRDFWLDHTVFAKTLRNLKLRDFNDPAQFKDLDEVFFEILSAADNNPRQPFREGFSLWREGDLEGFYARLKTSLRRLETEGKEENGFKMTPQETQRIMERFTRLRDLKESYHNFIYILHIADKEALGKFASSFLAEDVDFMFENVRGVGYAMRLQEHEIARIAANNDGRLPNELMAKDDKGHSQWEDMTYKLFEQAIKSKQIAEYQSGKKISLEEMKPWQIKIALEMGYGFSIVNLRLPELLTRVKGARGYRSGFGEKLKLDPIRGIFEKFKTPKPGFTILYAPLYMLFTGDTVTGIKMWKEQWSIDEVIKQIDIVETDPRWANRIWGVRNILDITTHWGKSSLWGIEAMTEKLSREVQRLTGFSIKLRLNEEKIKKELKGLPEKQVKQKIKESHRVNQLKDLDRVPAAFVHGFVHDPNFHNLRLEDLIRDMKGHRRAEEMPFVEKRFELIAEAVGNDEVQQTLRGIDEDERLMEDLVVHSSIFEYFKRGEPKLPGLNNGELRVDSFSKLWVADTANKDETYQPSEHLVKKERDRVDSAIGRFTALTIRLEGDLQLVQQVTFSRSLGEAKEGKPVIEKIIDSDYEAIKDDIPEIRKRRIEQAKKYARLIKRTASGFELNPDNNDFRIVNGARVSLANERDRHGYSYVERTADRLVERKERYHLSTTDVPYEELTYASSGGRAWVRRIIDANATAKGGEGLMPYLLAYTANPKMEDLAAIMQKEIYNNIVQYYDVTAQEFCGLIAEGTLGFYGEKNWASYSGIFGDIANLPFITDYLERHGGYKMLSSVAKVLVDHAANSWGPNERYRFIRLLNGMNLLAKNPHPTGWGAGENYTAKALEERTGSRVRNVWKEILAYTPMVIPIMIFEGFREAGEEEKKR